MSRLAMLDGRRYLLVAAVAVALLLVSARFSAPLFVAVAIGLLVIVGYGAARWPLSTLVGSAIASLADPVIVPRVMPAGMDLGPIGASEPLLAVVGLVIGINAVRRRRLGSALRDPVMPLTIVFVALAMLSALVNATPPTVAVLGIFMTVDALAIYFVARMVPVDVRAGGAAITAIVGAGVLVALFGIAQVVLDPNLLGFFSFEGRFGEGGRITSFLGNPNMVAAVIGLVMPFTLFGGRHLEGRRWRWVSRVALYLLVLALLLTFSRGAWLAVGIAAIIGAVLVDWRSLILLAAALVLAWGTATVMPRNLAVAQSDVVEPPPSSVPDLIDSTFDRFDSLGGEKDLRIRFLRDGLPIITDHLLIGVGPGRYGGAAASIIKSPVYEQYDTGLFRFRTVHNFWLHLLGESGALGTAVFLVLLLGLLIRFVREAHHATGLRFVILAGASTTILVAGFNSLTEMVLEGNMPVLLVWLIAGIASTLAPARPLVGLRWPLPSRRHTGSLGRSAT